MSPVTIARWLIPLNFTIVPPSIQNNLADNKAYAFAHTDLITNEFNLIYNLWESLSIEDLIILHLSWNLSLIALYHLLAWEKKNIEYQRDKNIASLKNT